MRIIIIIIATFSFAHSSAWMKNRSATSKYKKGKYVEAEKEYHAAEVEAPEKKELAFNRGCALYKAGKFEEALKEFEKAKSLNSPEMKKKSSFNTANTLFKKGLNSQDESARTSVEEAAKIYKEILKREPGDIPSRRNLEKALHVIEQMKKQEEQQKKNQDQKQDKNDKQNQDQKQDQNKNQNKDQDKNKNNDNKEQKGDQKGDKDKQEKDENKQQPQPKPGEMSKEEATKLLDALKENEQEKQKKLMLLRSKGKKLEKDW
ncbi:MAG: tetratricopeptide repeat protein [Fibrobacteres bacterium]|nr:tetratricopeptide repeat protein [Fibrobacterota bacterium]